MISDEAGAVSRPTVRDCEWLRTARNRPRVSCFFCNGYGGYASLECGACEGSGSLSREHAERVASGGGRYAIRAKLALREAAR